MDLWLYVYGNSEFLWTIINSVNFFMHNAMNFFKLSAVLSLLCFAIEATGVLPTKGYDWMRFVKVYMLINIFVLVPYPGGITVHDELTNENFVIDEEENTISILNRYIDESECDFDKNIIKGIFEELYKQACEVE